MALIHRQPFNRILRGFFYPLRKLIPEKYYFAIDGEISVRLTEGKTMRFAGNPTSNLVRLLFWYGYKGFEPKEYDIFVHLSKHSKCLFDVGANLGYYTVLSKLFNPDLNVHSFEPLPGVNKFLRKNIAINKISGVIVSASALSEKDGVASFFANRNPRFPQIEEHLFGDNSLDENFPNKAYDQVEVKVKTETLDNYCLRNLNKDMRIDFLKMDTEGSENLVLRGASDVLSNHKPVIMCEVVRGFIEDEIEQILKGFGYEFYRLNNRGLVRVDTIKYHEGKEDYFMVHPQKRELLSTFFK